MMYIPMSKNRYIYVDDVDYFLFSRYNYFCSSDGGWPGRKEKIATQKYKRIAIYNDIWIAHNGPIPDGYIIDHINNNSLDNRLGNLRLATQRQNCQNRTKAKDCQSKYKGVYKFKAPTGKPKWRAQIYVPVLKRQIAKNFPQTLEGEIEAAQWYNQQAIKIFGKFAKLNEI